eukprot:1188580-Prorocentrum_minimum.AAC.7
MFSLPSSVEGLFDVLANGELPSGFKYKEAVRTFGGPARVALLKSKQKHLPKNVEDTRTLLYYANGYCAHQVLAFMGGVWLFETYLEFRQRKYLKKETIPEELKRTYATYASCASQTRWLKAETLTPRYGNPARTPFVNRSASLIHVMVSSSVSTTSIADTFIHACTTRNGLGLRKRLFSRVIKRAALIYAEECREWTIAPVAMMIAPESVLLTEIARSVSSLSHIAI